MSTITDRQASNAATATPAQVKHTVADLFSALSTAMQTLQGYFPPSEVKSRGPHA